MDIKNILLAAGSLGAMGLVFGAGLAYASQKFAVKKDPKVEAVFEALPSVNCGGCGYPGCMQFAEAVVAGDAEANGCPVGGEETALQVSEIMGVEVDTSVRQVARVLCKGDKEKCASKYDYEGINDCVSANMLENGPKKCEYGCMGLGSCVDVCEFDALIITDNKIAEVIPENCVACGKCIDACPKDIIEYVPEPQHVIVDCMNEERGGFVKKNCDIACIACGICERSCPFDAIKVENNIAKIDYEKCTECMICYEKCPTNAISGDPSRAEVAEIDPETCVGCQMCKKRCPVDAISGELKENHVVDKEKCIGCGECLEACPVDAIQMK